MYVVRWALASSSLRAYFYRWKKYAGHRHGVAELLQPRHMEEENRRLKQLVADLSLDKTMLQEVIRKS